MNGEPLLVARGVWKFFGDFAALRDVSLDIARGATIALLGRNGAGKTTLLRLLASLASPSRGAITVGGAPVRDDTQRRRFGVIGHGIWLYDELSATENLDFFARLYGVADPQPRVARWLEETGLAAVRNSPVREFSRGMRQRLAIARAFLHDPEILLLDEPFTALDDRAVELLAGLVRRARQDGRTVLLSTHQLREALDLATDVAVLDRGRLVFRGSNTAEIRAAPDDFYRRVTETAA